MTINQVIERVDERKPNVFSDQMKANWIMQLDGTIYAEVLRGRPAPALPGDEETDRLPPTQYPEDGDVPLLVTSPYDILYDRYVEAMIDLYNREVTQYNNSSILFNEAMDTFKKHYHRTHDPVGPNQYVLP